MKNAIRKTCRNKGTMEIGKIIKLTKTPQGLTRKRLCLNVELYFISILYSVLLQLYYSILFSIMYYRFSLKKRWKNC